MKTKFFFVTMLTVVFFFLFAQNGKSQVSVQIYELSREVSLSADSLIPFYKEGVRVFDTDSSLFRIKFCGNNIMLYSRESCCPDITLIRQEGKWYSDYMVPGDFANQKYGQKESKKQYALINKALLFLKE